MIDLTHILDFATQLPHPSDLGLIKPSGGISLLPAIFGLVALFQVFQFFYYGLPANEPKEGWGLSSSNDSSLLNYRWKQFAGVQILVIIIASSVMLAGPEKIFFPFEIVPVSPTCPPDSP